MSDSKYCSKCDKIKRKIEFFNNKSRYDGLSGFCKSCQNIYLAKHKANNKIRVETYVKNNPEIIKRTKRKFYIENKDRLRDGELRSHYGITLEQFNKILEEQNGVCYICLKPETMRTNRIMNLAVDHCHETGKIRGLLCSYCNRALGLFKDDISSIKRAVEYLSRNNEK